MAYANIFVNLLYNLLITPVVIRMYGQSEYGIFSVCASAIQYLNLFQFGFGTTYLRYFIKFEQDGNQRKAEELNGMFFLIYLVITIAVIAVGALLTVNIEFVLGGKITAGEYATAKKLLVLMIANMAITLSATQFTVFVLIREKFIFQKGLALFVTTLKPLIVLPIVLLGYKSVMVTMFLTSLTLFSSCVSMWYCFARLKMKFRFTGFDARLFGEMSNFTFFIFLQQSLDIFNWQIDKFLIARFWGVRETAIYEIGATFCKIYIQLTTLVIHFFIPKVTRIIAQKQGDNLLTDLLVKTGRIQFFLGAYVLFSFIFFGHNIVSFYAGKGYEKAYYIGLLLIIPLVLPLSMNLATHILRAKAKHKVQSIIYVLVAFLNLLVSIPLCKLYGEIGAALGTFIGMIVANNVIQVIYIQKVSGLNMKKWFREIFSICQSLVIPGVTGIFMMRFIDTQYISEFFASAIFFTIIYVGSAWSFGMNTEEKLIILNPIKVMINKTKFFRVE